MDERIELIVQYVGEIERVQAELGFSMVKLLGGFAVLQIDPGKIAELSAYPEIVYVETPKRLFFEVSDGKTESCLREVQSQTFELTPVLNGAGTLVAVIDSGVRVMRLSEGSLRCKDREGS